MRRCRRDRYASLKFTASDKKARSQSAGCRARIENHGNGRRIGADNSAGIAIPARGVVICIQFGDLKRTLEGILDWGVQMCFSLEFVLLINWTARPRCALL